MSDDRESLSRMGRYWALPRDMVEYLIEQWERRRWEGFKNAPAREDGFEDHVDYMKKIGAIGRLAAESILTRYADQSDDEEPEQEEAAARPRRRRYPQDSG